jgi:CheY-like chemotaxis protein
MVNAESVQCEHQEGDRPWLAIEEVCKATERAAELVRQLLAFSRRQAIQPVNVDLNDLIQSVLKMIQRVIGEHIELNFIPGNRLDTVCVDKGQIEQVLMNLCVNARDAMPRGGTLTIRTRETSFDGDFCRDHPWAAAGRYLLIAVADTGHGMDAETLGHVFEPFFTTKGVGEGTGLGLATVYGIVKQHKGLINVLSEPDRGTLFEIYLPASGCAEVVQEVRTQAPVVGGTETILVAEDEPSVMRLVAMILEEAGYTVLTAVNGEAALRAFEENAGRIDLVLLDVMMPGLGGRQVMENLQARYSGTRFLFCSGYSDKAIPAEYVLSEGLRLIRKPFHKAQLLREVRQILDS